MTAESVADTTPVVVNGEQNSVLLHLINSGEKNYTLVSASASYHDVNNHWALVRRFQQLPRVRLEIL
jgi:hypothetical protein